MVGAMLRFLYLARTRWCSSVAAVLQLRIVLPFPLPIKTWMENVPGRSHPSPRAFGGGCALPNGMLMVYGGWNPRQGTYNCFWAACVDEVGSKTDFFQKLAEAPQEPEVENDDSDEDSMFSIPMMLRMAQMAHLDHGRVGLQRQNFGTGGYPGFFEGAEEEDEEHEELEELDDDTDEARRQGVYSRSSFCLLAGKQVHCFVFVPVFRFNMP